MKTKADRLEQIYDQLADLLQAGINLAEAVEHLPERTGDISTSACQRAAEAFRSGQLKQGFRILDLPDRDVEILTVSQKAGAIDQSLASLSGVYGEWIEVRSSAVRSLAWLFGTGLMVCAVPGVLTLIWVGFRAAFATGQQGLAIGMGLLAGGAVFLGLTVIWAGLLVYLGISFQRMYYGESPPGPGRLILSLPLVRTIDQHLNFSLVYLQWDLMYRAGVAPDHILRALDLQFPETETVLPYVADQLAGGASLRQCAILREFLPGNDYGALCTGEEAGTLDESLARLKHRHMQAFRDLLSNLPAYMQWAVSILYGLSFLLALLAIIYLLVSGGGILSSSALPEGTL